LELLDAESGGYASEEGVLEVAGEGSGTPFAGEGPAQEGEEYACNCKRYIIVARL
jgi:hypothetical protein